MFLCAYVSRKNHFYSEKKFSKKIHLWGGQLGFAWCVSWLVGWLVGRLEGGLKKILEKYWGKMDAKTEFSVQKNSGTSSEKN